MDFSDQVSGQKEQFDIENSEGAGMLRDIQGKEKAEEDKRQDGKFTSSFESSDLSETGPAADEFDYSAEHAQGNAFKPGEDGGITLNNANIKPLTREIAGHDATTGKKFFDRFSDEEGYIQEGMGELRESKMNTVTGAPPDDLFPLSKIANGVMADDKTYDDFLGTVGESWSDQQKKVAWDSAKAVKETKQDIKDYGARYLKENADVEYVRSEGIQEDIEETELVSSPTWIQSGKTVMEHFNPGGAEGMTEQEVHDFNLNFMSNFNYNLPMMMFYTYEIGKAKNPELAKSMLYLMDQNDATNVSAASFGRGLGGLASDITVYASLGGGVLLSRATAAGMRMGLRKVLTKMATVTAAETAVGATEGAIAETSRQAVEGAAGEREELDEGQVAKSAAISGAVTATVGTGAATLGDPVLRKFGIDTMRKAHKNITAPVSKSPLHRQRGAIGVERTPAQVEFRSKLDNELDMAFGKKSAIPVKKLKNKIKGWLGEGKIKKEEVDWAGINDLENGSITRSEMKFLIDDTRPTPTVTPVSEVKFEDYSLGNPVGGYREKIITIDNVGEWKGPKAHFGSLSPEGRANVGHLRMASSGHSGSKGTMLLEGQSDIRKQPRFATSTEVESRKALKLEADETAKKEITENIIRIEKKLKTLDYTSDEIPKLQTELDGFYKSIEEVEFSMLSGGKLGETPFTPYRNKKSSNDLIFRSAIMEAMNDGSEFLAWPKTQSQIAKIQGWDEGSKKAGFDEVVNQYTKDLPKTAKSHGFKVEEFIPDEFKDEGNEFYRIVFDRDTKTKWQKEGAAMYSFGAPVAVSEKKKQERNKKGQFK